MHDESKQFFDGLLLGSLVIGVIIVTLIAFFLFNGAQETQDTESQVERDLSSIQPVIIVDELPKTIDLAHEIGQSIVVNEQEYVIHKSVEDIQLGITYRGLQVEAGSTEVFASLWSVGGQQLDYLATTDLLTVSGVSSIQVLEIISNHALLLQDDSGLLLEYDLEIGLVSPQESENMQKDG
jgi:hypothetical protein